jgi:hypothetical protein
MTAAADADLGAAWWQLGDGEQQGRSPEHLCRGQISRFDGRGGHVVDGG